MMWRTRSSMVSWGYGDHFISSGSDCMSSMNAFKYWYRPRNMSPYAVVAVCKANITS